MDGMNFNSKRSSFPGDATHRRAVLWFAVRMATVGLLMIVLTVIASTELLPATATIEEAHFAQPSVD